MSFVYVFLGGGLGAAARHAVALGLPSPWATQVVNVLGSLLLGYLLARGVDGPTRHLLATGFCGGFTTYSTFNAETLSLAQSGDWTVALGNIGITFVVCILAGALGMWWGRQ